MNTPPILVNGKPFFGRKEEQRDFRNDLKRALNPDPDEADDPSPFIIYLYGDGGMGKTTLLRRFRDIVKAEFSAFTVTYIDWEREQQRSTALKVERSRIPLTAVLDSFYYALLSQHPEWQKPLEIYQAAVEQEEEIRLQAEELFKSHDERDTLAPLRGVGATFLGKFLRATAEGTGVAIGDEGENAITVLAEMGIEATENEARRLLQQTEQRLRTRLTRDELKMLLNPDMTLAQQMGTAIKGISTPGRFRGKRPLLFFWDTYEIIDNNDTKFREMMNAAGANTVWVMAGRNNLVRSGPYGKEFFIGYQDMATRFRAFDMKQMTLGDVRDYFNAVASERPLDEPTASAIFQATRAIPLAVREAADLWKQGLPLAEIVADTEESKTGAHIVRVMTERYHLHCINNLKDQYDLYALALANGDKHLLAALLQPVPPDPKWHLDSRLRELERAYASVHRDQASLHEDAVTFFVEYLRDPIHRYDSRTVDLIDRAITNLQSRLAEAEVPLHLIEECHADETWRDLALKLADFYFWKGEAEGWKWVAPRYIEGTVYSRPMLDGLLKMLLLWKRHLSRQNQQRIEKLEGSERKSQYGFDPHAIVEMMRWEEAGWLSGEGRQERLAIVTYWQAQVAYINKMYSESLKYFDGIYGLPENGKELVWRVMRDKGKVYHSLKRYEDAVIAFQSSINANPKELSSYYYLGSVYQTMKRHEEAIELFQKALLQESGKSYICRSLGYTYLYMGLTDNSITHFEKSLEINSTDNYTLVGLGRAYYEIHKYEEAISFFERALLIDPNDGYAFYMLGEIYTIMSRYEKSITCYKRALKTNPQDPFYNAVLATAYYRLYRYEDAITYYEKTIELDPVDVASQASLADCYRSVDSYESYTKHINIARSLKNNTNSYGQACVEAIDNNLDIAISLLKISISDGSYDKEWASRDPDLDSLRDDPRFRALVGLDDPAPS